MHYIKQWRTAIQIALFRCRPNFPYQHANSSTTFFGITQWMPNKVNTIDHKSKAKGQWIRRWSIDSSFLLHKWHQSKINIFYFQRLLMVKIFPKAIVQEKTNATLDGTLGFHINILLIFLVNLFKSSNKFISHSTTWIRLIWPARSLL